MNVKVLVLGGTGFIGRHFVSKALSEGCNVTVISLNSAMEREIGVEYIQCDITNSEALSSAIKNKFFDYVVNLSGYIDHSSLEKSGLKIVQSHHESILQIISLLDKKRLKKFLQVGSSDEYGDSPSPQNEAMREKPFTPYSYAKTAATHLLQMLYRLENFPACVVRLFLVYGPGQKSDRFIPFALQACSEGKTLDMTFGEQIRDFCYVKDVADALFLAMINEKTVGQVINIGSGCSYKIKDVVDAIIKTVGSGDVNFGAKPYRNGENMSLFPDLTKCRLLLGWKSKTELEEGLSETYKWISHG